MDKKSSIFIKADDHDDAQEVSIYRLAKYMDSEQFAKLFDNWLNFGGKQFREGQAVGKHLFNTHPTLQRCLIAFCLGIVTTFAEKKFTDARNEFAIEAAQKIKDLMDDGTLKLGMYI